MNLKHIYILLLFFSFAFAQAQQQIEIKYSGFLEFKEEETPGLKIMTRDDSGQIHIVHVYLQIQVHTKYEFVPCY